MSYRKTKLIQERNILLERKYILEQAPAAPAVPATPPPTSPTSAPTTGETQEKKFTKDQINKAPNCSGFKGIDNPKYEKKEQNIDGKIYVYYLTEKKDTILCRAENKEK